jgi:hypothetical protein
MLEKFDWSIGRYSFGINMSRCMAYLTDRGRKWNTVKHAGDMPNVHKYLEHLGDDARILSAGIQTSEEDMSVALRSTATHTLKERVVQYIADQEDAAWKQARITQLEVRVPGVAAEAAIDFHRGVISTNKSVSLRTFVELTARYVARLTDEEVAELLAKLDGTEEESEN